MMKNEKQNKTKLRKVFFKSLLKKFLPVFESQLLRYVAAALIPAMFGIVGYIGGVARTTITIVETVEAQAEQVEILNEFMQEQIEINRSQQETYNLLFIKHEEIEKRLGDIIQLLSI